MSGIKKVLVIGKSVRNIACSARKAGYTVHALDRFGDVDLQKCANKSQILEDMPEAEIHNVDESFFDADAVILGPGFEHLKFENALNNSKETMEEAGNKSKLPKKLKSMDIPHPETCSLDRSIDMVFPLILKPKSGSGGMKNIIVRDDTEMNIFRERNDSGEFVAQEFINGIPCSVSLICTGDEAAVVALNEQLIGIPWLTRLPFAYCGNITPFQTKFKEKMEQYAKQIANEFKLKGSNGVDFMLNDEGIKVLEVNPRFQGSIDTIELAFDFNVFDAHVRSFFGELPEPHIAKCFAAKNIIYADRELVIEKTLSDALIKCMKKGQAADIPCQGIKVLADEPITTVLATERNRETVLETVSKYAGFIKSKTEA